MWSERPNVFGVRVGSSASPSSEPHFSDSPSSILQPTARRGGRSMEEVWKSITHHHNRDQHSQSHGSITTTRQIPTRGMILQDFLAGPPKQTSTPETPPSVMSDTALHRPPATILSLNSSLNLMATPDSPRCQAADNDGNQRVRHHRPPPSPCMPNIPFVDAVRFQEQPGIFSFCGRKRSTEQQQMDGAADCGDRRHSRMIKNRQSAARSRARKQAYTNELEVLVRNLTEENDMLKKEYAKLKEAMAAQLPVKRKLLRTSTAPF